jgi:hypothetical protein
MYQYLRDNKQMNRDALLETRLTRLANNTLRSTIEARFRPAP